MPELPEVESLKRSLESHIVGKKVLNIEIQNAKIISGKGTKRLHDENKVLEFKKNLINKKIISLERRAKNIIINFDSSELLLVHLKMTGQLVYSVGKVVQPSKHTHIIFTLSTGILHYNDIRQFGYCLYYPSKAVFEQEKHFDNLGLEPFDTEFTDKYLIEKFSRIKSPLKKVLLDQKVVVGCGNIYCDEACFASKILPTRLCNSLSITEVQILRKNILSILQKAINSGGSSIANYLLADGSRGNYADYHKVYGKAGKACPNCKSILQKIQLAGRTTVFCPKCQK